ncbi:M14 family metallopeptidase [Cellulophaga sp. L1A9]|uniref:M14 family metallopeptidase n=1 Tax=Cellulophaga sp. L1A9 TaxID=2686362 RepID=UPI00131BC323|nr:M14 family metallopeptidase [Cellulophaga sp. L1A9]
MRKFIFLFTCISTIFLQAQDVKKATVYAGQGETVIVPTDAKPTQKQWKGNFTFKDSDVIFSNDFDGARLNGIIKENDSTFIALITSENTPINISPWYAFKVASKEPKQINVTLTYQEGIKHRYYPKLSDDGENWEVLDSTNYTAYEKGNADFGMGSLPLSVTLKLSVSNKPLWVAGQELETSASVREWATDLTTKKDITYSSIGKSKEGRDMGLLSIGKADSKNMILIISRQHPPEVTGYLAMKAFVETLTSDSKLAQKFRKKFGVFVVPLMNPDGVDNGHWRHNLGGIDLNRDWANFNQPETSAVRDFMVAKEKETEGKFYFGIDFHSTWDDIYYTIDSKYEGNMPGLVPDWLTAVKADLPGYDPNIKSSDKLQPTAVSKNYFFVAHEAEALVFEIGDNTPRDFIKEKGEVSANKLMELMLSRLKEGK